MTAYQLKPHDRTLDHSTELNANNDYAHSGKIPSYIDSPPLVATDFMPDTRLRPLAQDFTPRIQQRGSTSKHLAKLFDSVAGRTGRAEGNVAESVTRVDRELGSITGTVGRAGKAACTAVDTSLSQNTDVAELSESEVPFSRKRRS
jgi:hypothetical protein